MCRPVLQQSLLPWIRATVQNNFILVQDNAPPHTARATMEFLGNQDMEITDWPSKSPDMNPKEHMWDRMAAHICDMDNLPTTAAQLHVLCSRPGLPKGLLGWGPWHGACHVDWVLFSLHVVVTPSINQVPTLYDALYPFYRLPKFEKKCNVSSFVMDIFHWYVLQWHHCTMPASARKLHRRCYSRINYFFSWNTYQLLKLLLKEKYSNGWAGSVFNWIKSISKRLQMILIYRYLCHFGFPY